MIDGAIPDSAPLVLVAGAGAAGISAAIAAARRGARVALVDARAQPGGTVAHALIHTLGGLYDSRGEPICGSLAQELCARLVEATPLAHKRRIGRVWTLGVPPEAYAEVVAAWLRDEPRIMVYPGSAIVAVRAQGGCIEEVSWADPDGIVRCLAVDALIDCSGSASVTRLVDPALVDSSAAQAAAGLVVALAGIPADAVRFPASLLVRAAVARAVDAGQLPAVCAQAWFDQGASADEVYVKFALHGAEPDAAARIAIAALPALLAALRDQAPGFGQARTARIGAVGARDDGGIRGVYRLTVDDVRDGRRFADAVGRCSWPIELWDRGGGISFEYLRDGLSYDIPLAALTPVGSVNLWAAGRCLSADPFARASARVVGACWTMGEGVGCAAASHAGATEVQP